MNVDELMRIVRAEHLDAPVLYGAGRLHLDAVVLEHDGATWSVYLVDERTQPFESTLRTFASESDALDHVLRKLRQVEKSRRSMACTVEPIGSHDRKDQPDDEWLAGGGTAVILAAEITQREPEQKKAGASAPAFPRDF